MGGIAGLQRRDYQRVDPHQAARIVLALTHRGSLRQIVHIDEHCAVGSVGEQWPQSRTFFPPTDIVVVADARIDNHAELAAQLPELRRIESPEAEDLIAAAYRRWGVACVERLVGDFAFALWDNTKRLLMLARDRFGVKPLYYHCSRDLFAFSSEIRSLHALDETPRRVNSLRAAQYLTGTLHDARSTFFEDIERLPPAHVLCLSDDGLSLRRYWSPDARRELRLACDEEYEEAFRELFDRSVGRRIANADVVGTMLSGGLDSSSIACVARQAMRGHGTGQLHSFTGLFENTSECDEGRYVESVLAGGDIQAHTLIADAVSPLTDIDALMREHDEPFFSPNLFVHAGLLKEAGQQGVNLILDGFDGDTVVSHGMAHLTDLARRGQWRRLKAEVDGIARNFKLSRASVLWRRGIKPLVPEALKSPARRAALQKILTQRLGLLSPELASDRRVIDYLSDFLTTQSRSSANAREDHARRLGSGLIPFTLEVLDRTAWTYGVEMRYPFFDHQLAEFCVSLPSDQSVRFGLTRSILRRALRDVLPQAIAQRGDKGKPGSSFARNLLAFEGERIGAALDARGSLLQAYANMNRVRAALTSYRNSVQISDALVVWRALTLDLWLMKQCHEDVSIRMERDFVADLFGSPTGVHNTNGLPS